MATVKDTSGNNPNIDTEYKTRTKTAIYDEVVEIVHHLHNYEYWAGLHATPVGEVTIADFATMLPFTLDAGNDTWGSWIQILGSGDTPHRTGMTKFDPHQIQVTTVETANKLYRVQFAVGATGAAGLTAETYTEFTYYAAAAASRAAPVDILFDRIDVGTKMWARCWCDATNTSTFKFLLGIYESTG